MVFSEGVIIALIVCGTVTFTLFTVLKFWYASKCRTVDIKSGDSEVHFERNVSKEDKDIPYPTIPINIV